MPLASGSSQSTISHNISVERHAGKPEKQAIAIAESKARGDSLSSIARDALSRDEEYKVHRMASGWLVIRGDGKRHMVDNSKDMTAEKAIQEAKSVGTWRDSLSRIARDALLRVTNGGITPSPTQEGNPRIYQRYGGGDASPAEMGAAARFASNKSAKELEQIVREAKRDGADPMLIKFYSDELAKKKKSGDSLSRIARDALSQERVRGEGFVEDAQREEIEKYKGYTIIKNGSQWVIEKDGGFVMYGGGSYENTKKRIDNLKGGKDTEGGLHALVEGSREHLRGLTGDHSLSRIARDALTSDAFGVRTVSPKDVKPGDKILFRSINMYLPVTTVKKLSETDTRIGCSQGEWDFSNDARIIRND